MGATQEKCAKCERGWLVEDYSISMGRMFHYCNNCFRYKEDFFTDPAEPGFVRDDFSEKDLQEFLDDAFNFDFGSD